MCPRLSAMEKTQMVHCAWEKKCYDANCSLLISDQQQSVGLTHLHLALTYDLD